MLQKIKTNLFDHRTAKQIIFKNTFWLVLAEGIGRLATFILFIFVARILGATDYGKFSFAIAFVYLFSIFSDLGLSQIVTREFSREKEKEKEFSALLSLKIFLCLGTLFLILFSSSFITPEPAIRKIIWILAVYTLLNSFFNIIYAFLEARQRMEYESLFKISDGLLTTAFGLFVLFKLPSVENLSYAYLFEGLALLIIILLFFHFKIYKLQLSLKGDIWKRFLSMSWPLALAAAFTVIYNQTDSVMMGFFNQITQTGWYNAAFKITKVIIMPAVLLSQSFYPPLSISFKESKTAFQEIWTSYTNILILLAFPIMAGGMVLAPKIINFIYGSDYLPSVLVFQILIIMTGIILLYYSFNQALIAANQQKKVFWPVFYGAMLNIVLNLILIPKFSLYGAAIATVIANLLVLFLLFKYALKFTSINPFDSKIITTVIGAVLSSLSMYFIISQPLIYQFHVLFLVLIGAGTYFIFFFGYKKLVRQLFI
jgi:O-antigen/teichoic acid export membrane protein